MTSLLNFSGGACSLLAGHREIESRGRANVKLIFADTLIEHADLYEFNQRAEEVLGIQITRVCYGLTPWQLFRKEGLIGNNRFPICSVRLKREPLNGWMEANYELDRNQDNFIKPAGIVVLGFDHTEFNRVQDMQREHPTWRISAPMADPPLWDKCRIIQECINLGFKEQTLYRLGFPHNNCGGACVRAGISHFVHLYRVLPEKFLEWENEEQQTIAEFRMRGIEGLTVLKDRRGGKTVPLSLRELRLRIEAGEEFPRDQWGGCGCGGAN